METKNENNKISVILSKEETIVLLEWLVNFNEKEHHELFEHQSEQKILFDLEAELEKMISETFLEDYQNILDESRNKIRDSY